MKPKNKRYFYLCFSVLICLHIIGCKKFVDAGAPETQVNAENVYTNDATAIAAMTALYAKVSGGSPTPIISSGTRSFSLLCGLSADEYILFSGANDEMTGFYKNALMTNTSNNTNIGTEYWNVIYDHLYSVNSIIEGLVKSKGLTEQVKQQLLGEAKFMRAFFYFYLVNLYGDVPLIISTDYTMNATMARTPKAVVYEQIKIDLKEAQDLLSSDYLDGKLQKYAGTPERVRPTKWSAASLLSRVYLYTQDWNNAEVQSNAVISNTSLFDTVSLNNVFLKNSKEAIWQLQPVKSNQNTDDSKMFIVTTGFNSNIPIWLSDTLLNSFELNDKRKINGNWINSVTISGNTFYYPYKYKNNTATVTEYLMVLRLAEQYLIRAEARAHLNKTAEAQADLNIIRRRAGLPNTTASSQSNLLAAILHERQIEFFSEWGHRWLDLKRTNNANTVMSIITPKKGGTWEVNDQLYPLPQGELQRNSNLTQNPGY